MTPSADRRIPVAAPVLDGNELRYVTECIESTWISSSGRFLTDFEAAFADFCGVKHAVACNNGTTALHLALAALGIGPGDEVIVPDLTYIASANCVSYCGAKPVFVDNDPRTLNIAPSDIERAINSRTKAIMPVHLYGHPCDMDPILEIAKRHSLFVIEDAAEAHGARYRGAKVGGFGNCASFSFYGNKIITTGEGGAVTTNDGDLAARLRLLRSQGMDPTRRYWFPVIGYNYRMTNLAAAIGLAQLERIGDALEQRQRLADWYAKALANVPHLTLPYTADGADHVYWMYTVLLTSSAPTARDELMRRLDARGIETRPVFHPMHALPPYAQDGGLFPNATLCAERGLNLPTHGRMTREDVLRVAEALQEILSG
jgi:perosamine synthetase